MGDPRAERDLIDFLKNNGIGQVLEEDHAQYAHAGGAEADLKSFSLPANSLKEDGAFIVVEAWGTFAANANSKRVRLTFGATDALDSVASTSWNGHKWHLKAAIYRTGGSAEKAVGMFLGATAAGAAAVIGTAQSPTTPAEDTAAAITVRTRGTGVAASDVVQEGFTLTLHGKR